jgi:hypothetical protein
MADKVDILVETLLGERTAYGISPGDRVVVHLEDGTVASGTSVDYDEDHFTVKLESGQTVTVYKTKVQPA